MNRELYNTWMFALTIEKTRSPEIETLWKRTSKGDNLPEMDMKTLNFKYFVVSAIQFLKPPKLTNSDYPIWYIRAFLT